MVVCGLGRRSWKGGRRPVVAGWRPGARAAATVGGKAFVGGGEIGLTG